MDTTIDALKNLYVALGGSADDVADLVIIPDLINALATVAGAVAATAKTTELPTNPTANGTYNLQAVKSNSGTTISWAAKE